MTFFKYSIMVIISITSEYGSLMIPLYIHFSNTSKYGTQAWENKEYQVNKWILKFDYSTLFTKLHYINYITITYDHAIDKITKQM